MKHELAYIHPDAQIGEGTIIEPFAYIEGDVVIGNNTRIRSGAKVLDGARIGEKCDIHSGAVISGIPQDLKFHGEDSQAIIGNNTTIRECVTVNRGTDAKGKTIVGDNCLLMAYVHIAHDCILGNRVIIGNSCQIAGEVEIDDWAILGGVCAAHQFTHIGTHVMVSGGTLIGKDIPPYVRAAREPISYVGVNSVGLRRRGFANERIREIQEIYRHLYQRGFNNSDACDIIEADLPATAERDEVLDFVRGSKRGIIKGYNS